jgi:hypothetical protein
MRTAGSANVSTSVKRTKATSSPWRALPCRCISRAAWRRRFDSSQRGDSGMLRRIQKTISAGSTPIRNIQRHALGPMVPIVTQMADARMLPIG